MDWASIPDGKVIQLLRAARGKSFESGFRELVRRYKNGIMTFLTRYTGDPGTAEDLAQETFVRVYKNLHRYDPRARFSTWIFTIAGNLAKDEFKRRRRHPSISFEWQSSDRGDTSRPIPAIRDEHEGPGQVAVQAETGRRVQEALAKLDAPDREVLILRDIQGLKYEEIAEILQLPLGTVKSRIARARFAFRTLWEELSR